MAFLNPKKKEIQIKIVYYGPGRGGKTANLEYLFKQFRDYAKSEMVSIKTTGDRTLFFDFLPFELGKVDGHDVRVQLYTVPGQTTYCSTRRLVLTGVDGIVFVADSLPVRRMANIQSLKDLERDLAYHKKSLFHIPIVMQYNKRDLEKENIPLLSVEELEKDLNSQLKVPSCEASAMMGNNVILILKKIVSLTLTSVLREVKEQSVNIGAAI
jgi:signal recognition particle receptor subunit beta